jgi:hypothetical protein
MKIKPVAHNHRDGPIREINRDLSVIPETETSAPDPTLYDTGKAEGEAIEDSLGDATPTRLVAGQLLFLKYEHLAPGLAQPVGDRSAGRTCPDDDDVVAHHLL